MWICDLKHKSENQRRNYVDPMSHVRFYNSHWEKEIGVSCPWGSFPPHSSPNKKGWWPRYMVRGSQCWTSQTQLRSLGLGSYRAQKPRQSCEPPGRNWLNSTRGYGRKARGLQKESEGRGVLLLSGGRLAKITCLMGNAMDPHRHSFVSPRYIGATDLMSKCS